MDHDSAEKEALLQELHSYKSKVSHLQNLYGESLALESQLTSLHQKHEDLENEFQQVVRIKEKQAEQNKVLEGLVEAGQNECQRLTQELNQVKTQLRAEPAPPRPCQCDTVISSLQAHVESLEKKLELLEAEKSESNKLYSLLQSNYESTAGQLEEMTVLYESKRDELQSARQIIEGLTEDKVLLEAELTQLKAPSGDVEKRGNSLFAEVEDKRKSTAKNLEVMQLKYTKLKQIYNQSQQELRNLKDENLQLLRETNSDKVRQIEARRMEAYRTRIADLEKMLAIYSKRPESPIIKTVDLPDLPMVSAMVQRARDEAESMRLEFLRKSQAESEHATKVYMAERQVRLIEGSLQAKDKEMEKLKERLGKLEETEKAYAKLKEELQAENKENGGPLIKKLGGAKLVRFAPSLESQGETEKPKMVKAPKCAGIVPIIFSENSGPVFHVSNVLKKRDKDALKKPE